MPETEDAFACICKALADPMRFGLLSRIARAEVGAGEVGCKVLVAEFPVSQATISHHLKELQRAGLIESRMDGPCLFLRPNVERLRGFCADLRERLALDVDAGRLGV
ncbi:MAG: metalloregulator ArsR/SmtB family transcription factor [Planctomycetota bacterium]